jgi:hypothetical protein
MLKFDNFQTEGFSGTSLEYQSRPNDPNKETYLDKYSRLLDTQKKLTEYSDNLALHLEAYHYCEQLETNSRNPPKTPLSYTIYNRYFNDRTDTGNTYTQVPSKCTDLVDKWFRNQNTPLTDPVGDNFDPKSTTNGFDRNLATDLSYISFLVDKCNDIVMDISNNYTPPSKTYNEIIKTYNSNVALRRKLDTKMNELYSGDQSIAMYQRKSVDSVVYANVLWTILATSLIYYVFVKI